MKYTSPAVVAALVGAASSFKMDIVTPEKGNSYL